MDDESAAHSPTHHRTEIEVSNEFIEVVNARTAEACSPKRVLHVEVEKSANGAMEMAAAKEQDSDESEEAAAAKMTDDEEIKKHIEERKRTTKNEKQRLKELRKNKLKLKSSEGSRTFLASNLQKEKTHSER